MPLTAYERQRLLELYRHLDNPSPSEIVDALGYKGIMTTR